jgi:hypothetical protein
MTGASLAQRLRGWSALEKAAFVAFWIEGKVTITGLTVKAMIAIVGANTSYVYAMLKYSDEARWQVCKGLLSLFPEKPKPDPDPEQLDLPLIESWSDEKVLATVKAIGVERRLEAAAAIEAGE